MVAPSVSGGFTMLESCDTGGPTGKAFSAHLSCSTPANAGTTGGVFAGGLNGTGSTSFGNAGTGNALQGGIFSVTSTDFSVANRLLAIHTHIISQTSRIGNLSASTGIMAYMNSSSLGTEEAAFPLYGGDTNVPANHSPCIVNVNRSTDAHIYSGTFDPTDVTHIGMISTFLSSFGVVGVESIGYVDPYKIINGETADKGSFATLTDQIDTDDTLMNESPTANMHHCFFAWGVGDGTTATEFTDSLKVFELACGGR